MQGFIKNYTAFLTEVSHSAAAMGPQPMSIINFIKEAGEKLFGQEPAAAAEAPDVNAANKTAADAITTYINTQNLKVDGLEAALDGATGTLSVAKRATGRRLAAYSPVSRPLNYQ